MDKLEKLKSEVREEFERHYGDGMTAPKDVYDYFMESLIEKAYKLGAEESKDKIIEWIYEDMPNVTTIEANDVLKRLNASLEVMFSTSTEI